MSRIDWKRSAGSFSSAFSTTMRSGSGTSFGNGPAARWMIACNTSGIGRSGKGSPSGQHLVQHHAEREDIAAGVERLSGGLLWRHVGDGSDDDARRVRASVTVRVASSGVASS